jgi:anti-anti-sigma factor
MGLDIFATELETNDKGKIIHLRGDFNDETSPKFMEFMENYLDEYNPEAVIINCHSIVNFDVQALSKLMQLYKNLRILKKGLILTGISESMMSHLEKIDSESKIPIYPELIKAKEIATYFITKKELYEKRKVESLRETPAALIQGTEKASFFKDLSVTKNAKMKSGSKTGFASNMSKTVKRYTTQDFTKWFQPEQTRRIREQNIDVLILQCPNNPFNAEILQAIDDTCFSYGLKYKSLLPINNRFTWTQALEEINIAKFIFIDFTPPLKKLENLVFLHTFAAIARMVKVEEQLVLINTTDTMPVLWRDIPVLYFNEDKRSKEKFIAKIDSLLLSLHKTKN